jgi:hypothetical protein
VIYVVLLDFVLNGCVNAVLVGLVGAKPPNLTFSPPASGRFAKKIKGGEKRRLFAAILDGCVEIGLSR